MELKDFVTQALADIAAGVAASKLTLGTSAAIATTDGYNIPAATMPSNMFQDYGGRIYSAVEFDVAVTTLDAVKGGGGINVLSFKAGGEVEGRAETASRIKFALTMRFD